MLCGFGYEKSGANVLVCLGSAGFRHVDTCVQEEEKGRALAKGMAAVPGTAAAQVSLSDLDQVWIWDLIGFDLTSETGRLFEPAQA